MAGLASRLLIARRVSAELAAVGSPAALLIAARAPYRYLGALGPALGDVVPHERPTGFGSSGRSPYLTVCIRLLEVAVGNSGPGLSGVTPTLRGYRVILNAVPSPVVASGLGAPEAIRNSAQLARIMQLATDLETILVYFGDVSRLAALVEVMRGASRPRMARQPWPGILSAWASPAAEPLELPIHPVFSGRPNAWPSWFPLRNRAPGVPIHGALTLA
jgi:hypothetical protein